MSPPPELLIWLLKFGAVSGFVSMLWWVIDWTRLSKWDNWRSPIGRTFLFKTLIVIFLLLMSAIGLFFHLTYATSIDFAWVQGVVLSLIFPVMLWRDIHYRRMHRLGQMQQGMPEGKDAPRPPGGPVL